MTAKTTKIPTAEAVRPTTGGGFLRDVAVAKKPTYKTDSGGYMENAEKSRKNGYGLCYKKGTFFVYTTLKLSYKIQRLFASSTTHRRGDRPRSPVPFRLSKQRATGTVAPTTSTSFMNITLYNLITVFLTILKEVCYVTFHQNTGVHTYRADGRYRHHRGVGVVGDSSVLGGVGQG
jgi:hypothetical protein